MGKTSREKGKRGEREFAALCRKHGFNEARRGQQFNGIEGKDVVGLPGFHVEVKRVERLNLSAAMDQAQEDATEGEIPIVAHRKNREPWRITIAAEEFLKIIKNKGG